MLASSTSLFSLLLVLLVLVLLVLVLGVLSILAVLLVFPVFLVLPILVLLLVLVLVVFRLRVLEDVPLDDGPPGVLQHLLPVLEARLVRLLLVPAEIDLPDGVAAADQIVVADLRKVKRGKLRVGAE